MQKFREEKYVGMNGKHWRVDDDETANYIIIIII